VKTSVRDHRCVRFQAQICWTDSQSLQSAHLSPQVKPRVNVHLNTLRVFHHSKRSSSMSGLIGVLAVICAIGSLVCLILVIVKMFQNDETTMGIVCIVTCFCGIGGLITFVYGWMKSSEWDIKNIMLAWTGCIVLSVLLNVVLMGMGAASIEMPPIE
jgi:hypothetical protein